MTRILLLLVSLFLLGSASLRAQDGHRNLRRGDKAYNDRNFEKARREYEAALEKENSAKGNYNAGNALFEQEDYEGAAKRYEEAAGLAEDPEVRSRAYRNLGDAHFQQENYQDAIESYKQSLRVNPDDTETKYNLSKAIRKIQQQQKQQQQGGEGDSDDQQDGEGQGGEGEPQDSPSQDQSGDPKDGEQQPGQPQDSPSENNNDQSSPSTGQSKANPGNTPKMSREEALRQLAQAAESEKETMKKLATGNQSGCENTKEW